jgi:hypothetical protein
MKTETQRRIQELKEEWERLDSTDFPPTPAAMNYYTERVRSIMAEINKLEKED